MLNLNEIAEGIEALKKKSSTLSSAEVVNLLKEDTVEVKGIHHQGSFNPFSYTTTEAMVSLMAKQGIKDPETLKKIKGWKVETPKKDIGPFWSIVEGLRTYAKSRCISGTSHMRPKELSEFLEKVDEGKTRWEAGKAELEEKYDTLKEAYFSTAEEALANFFKDDPFLAEEVLKDIKNKTLSKDNYLSRIGLIIDVKEPDSRFAFFKPEDAQTIEELSAEATRRQVLEMTEDCLQNIVKEVSSLYKNMEGSGGEALTTRQLMQYDKAVKRAAGDNIFSNPTISTIVKIMEDIKSEVKQVDFATAQADCEDLFGLVYKLEQGVDGITLNWICCPFPTAVLKTL